MGFLDILQGTETDVQRHEQTRENSAREAFQQITFTTKGTGHIVTPKPIMFDVAYQSEPGLAVGCELILPPDVKHYKFPLITAGVYSWVTDPPKKPKVGGIAFTIDKPATKPRDPVWVGAYLFFNIIADPLQRPRTDGSNLSRLQKQLTEVDAGTYEERAIKANIKEAQEALFLLGHPPKVEVIHHFTFSQVATKHIPEGIGSQLHADPTLAPQGVKYGYPERG